MNAGLRSLLRRIYSRLVAVNDISVKGVFKVPFSLFAINDFDIGFVFAKQRRRIAVNVEKIVAQRVVTGMNDSGTLGSRESAS